MDFLDAIFSIVPLLMLILFFVRIISTVKKKKKKKAVGLDPSLQSKEEENPTQSDFSHRTSAPEIPESLKASNDLKPERDDAYSISTARRGGALKRMKSLPELKKAVIWAEVIGKPKGLD